MSLHNTFLKSKLPPLPSMSRNSGTQNTGGRKRDYAPVSWNEYFSKRDDVTTKSGTFRVYMSAEPEQNCPILVMLHGGGFSALTWSHFCTSVIDMIHCQVMAIDLRGHGDTITNNENDLSAETLATDVAEVVTEYFKESMPSIFLVGHSMGGAVAVHIASREMLPTLIGVTVIDVVEGTALEALTSMQSFLRSRPSHFKSIEHAIEWSVRSGQIRNLDSAKVSMPGQIINMTTGKLSTNELDKHIAVTAETTEPFANTSSIQEESENEVECTTSHFKQPLSAEESVKDTKRYGWRIDLAHTEEHWPGWFKGMSELFLNILVPKMLLLASIEGLDKTLTVGQMQGKFQMMVLAKCGHAVHEDRPEEVAEVISSFLLRHRFTEPKNEFTRHMPAFY